MSALRKNVKKSILSLIACAMSVGNANSNLDSMFLSSQGILGGYGFLLVSKGNELTKFIEFDPMKKGKERYYFERKIVDHKKTDSIFESINNSGFRLIKDQINLPDDSIFIVCGETIVAQFKSNNKKRELSYSNPSGHTRHEDSTVAKLWSSVWCIRDSCLLPISNQNEN